LVRQFKDTKHIDGEESPYNIMPKVLGDLDAEEPNLIEIWDKVRNLQHGTWDNRMEYSFIRLGKWQIQQMPIAQMKSCVAQHQQYLWYVIRTWNLEHNNRFTIENDLNGPFTLQEAQEKFDSLNTGIRSGDHEIAVSNAALNQHVVEVMFNREVEHFFLKSLPWGLTEFGILTKEESKLIQCGGDMSGIHLFVGNGMANAGNDPAKWGDKLQEGLKKSAEALAELHQKIAILGKIESGVAAYGGWDKFRDDCKKIVIEALRKRDAKPKEDVA
jgi:hypothetical protein